LQGHVAVTDYPNNFTSVDRATPPPPTPVALEEVKVEEVGACEVDIEEFGL
jgi:hypothetical protein